MVQTQRKTYIRKVSGLSQDAWIILSDVRSPKKCDVTSFEIWVNSFFVEKCLLSSGILMCIFSKAEKLVLGTNAICLEYGSVTGKVVASLSGN